MCNLLLEDIGKRFYKRWLFREVSFSIKPGERLVLTGTNGSGKSTLMRIIAGQMLPTEGKVSYLLGSKVLPMERVYQHISWSGPYLQPYHDFTLEEHIKMHFRFRKCLIDDPMQLISILELEAHRDKKLRFYSSGMLQRVKVGTALFTTSDVLLLDEPTSNMDPGNASRMLGLIGEYRQNRCYVLASNMPREYEGFEQKLQLG